MISLLMIGILSGGSFETTVTFNQNFYPKLKPFYKHKVDGIPNQYVIKFNTDIDFDVMNKHYTTLQSLIAEANNEMGTDSFSRQQTFYSLAFQGYSGSFNDEMIERIRAADEVEYVEQDVKVNAIGSQSNAPWNLGRISTRQKLTSTPYTYKYDDKAGNNVTIYVIDSGININHQEFQGRAKWGTSFVTNENNTDLNGHGTHVAGTAAGVTYGVAKKALVVAVKVLDSSGGGLLSSLIKGIEWAFQDSKSKSTRSVANISIGAPKSQSLNDAVDAAVNNGLAIAVAAGNYNEDACQSSPSSAANGITVGASTLQDGTASFSNWGKCVHVYAPGQNILSSYIGSNTETKALSGTSMASPHIAGLMAYHISMSTSITPAQLKAKIMGDSTKNAMKNVPSDTPNNLAYNNIQT